MATLVFNATFTEPVTGFISTDLTNAGAATGCAIQVDSPTGNVYPVTVSLCSPGTVILHLAAGLLTDLAGNPNILTESPTVTIDRTAPQVTFDLQSGSDFGPSNTDNITNATSPVFDATFSEAVAGFTLDDLANAGGAAACTFSIGSPTGNKYPITASSCSAGTVVLQLIPTRVSDIAGNVNVETQGPSVTIERTPPTVSFDLQDASDTGVSPTDNLTYATNLVFNAIFSEPVYGLGPEDLSNGGSASACSFSVGTAGGNTYPVTASACSEGTVMVGLSAGGTMDIAGNLNVQTNGPIVTIDRVAPTVSIDLQIELGHRHIQFR